MTPKEKANDIYNRMVLDYSIDKWQTKGCALVAVDEILKICEVSQIDYWTLVKQEIEDI